MTQPRGPRDYQALTYDNVTLGNLDPYKGRMCQGGQRSKLGHCSSNTSQVHCSRYSTALSQGQGAFIRPLTFFSSYALKQSFEH